MPWPDSLARLLGQTPWPDSVARAATRTLERMTFTKETPPASGHESGVGQVPAVPANQVEFPPPYQRVLMRHCRALPPWAPWGVRIEPRSLAHVLGAWRSDRCGGSRDASAAGRHAGNGAGISGSVTRRQSPRRLANRNTLEELLARCGNPHHDFGAALDRATRHAFAFEGYKPQLLQSFNGFPASCVEAHRIATARCPQNALLSRCKYRHLWRGPAPVPLCYGLSRCDIRRTSDF